MSSKHTPGPWAASMASGQWEVRAGATRYCLASIAAAPPPFRTNGDSCREAANARLIAAAPDLLAALIDADEWLTAYVDGVGAEWDEMRAAVRAAIARAEGRDA